MAAFDLSKFRTQFPEFADPVAYPTPMIQFWADIAVLQVRECIWTTMWLNGVSLYVAHEITLAAQNAKAGKFGGMPGTSGGVPSDKTVGDVSISYDATSTSEKDAGYWNLTNYGKQFFHLMRLFGARAVQL